MRSANMRFTKLMFVALLVLICFNIGYTASAFPTRRTNKKASKRRWVALNNFATTVANTAKILATGMYNPVIIGAEKRCHQQNHQNATAQDYIE